MDDINAVTLEDLEVWSGGGEAPVQYDATIDEHDYYVRFRNGLLTVDVDDVEDVFETELTVANAWTDEETTVYLYLITDAILRGTLAELTVPSLESAPEHPMFVKGPVPRYPVGLACGKDGYKGGRRMNRHDRRKLREAGHHLHDGCEVRVGAKDVERWIAEHPEEHAHYRREYPEVWKWVERDLAARRVSRGKG